MSKYTYTDDMGEISGFGGGYEAECRAMVVRGLEWWDAHPEADPQFHGYGGVYGIITDDNESAKELSAAVCPEGCDCTGAMHQAAIGHVFFAHKNGWEKYCEEMRAHEKEEKDKEGVATSAAPKAR